MQQFLIKRQPSRTHADISNAQHIGDDCWQLSAADANTDAAATGRGHALVASQRCGLRCQLRSRCLVAGLCSGSSSQAAHQSADAIAAAGAATAQLVEQQQIPQQQQQQQEEEEQLQEIRAPASQKASDAASNEMLSNSTAN